MSSRAWQLVDKVLVKCNEFAKEIFATLNELGDVGATSWGMHPRA